MKLTRSERIRIHTRVGLLSAMAAILYVWPEIPIIPPIYKIDLSNIPVLLGAVSMGWLPGAGILLIKDLTGLLHSTSAGIGELADFLVSLAFMVVSVGLDPKRKGRRSALIGMIAGIVAMTVCGALVNYYILIPFYVGSMGLSSEAIISMVAKTIPAVDSMEKLIVMATVPFNLLKGAVITAVTFAIYKPLEHILKRKDGKGRV